MLDRTQGRNFDETPEKCARYFRNLLEHAGDAIFVLDADSGRVVDCNRRACDSLGYTREELYRMSVPDIDLRYKVQEVRDLWERLRPDDPVTIEGLHRRKDGSVFPVEVRIVLLDQSEPKLVMSIVRDITSRTVVEKALVESEKKLRDIATHMGEGLYVLDAEGHITFMNTAAEQLLGWSMADLEGKNAHSIVHHCRQDGVPLALSDCPIRKVIESGQQFTSSEEVFVRKDGAVFPVSIIASPIIEDGRIVASVATFRDITEMKRMQRELAKIQKLESVGTLAGGIAHDFNNLLQAILGHISLAKLYTDPSGTAYQQLTRAEDASEQARELSFRLLTFAKGGEPFRKVASMADLLRQTVELSLSGSNVAAVFIIPDDLRLVRIDEGQMRQVISNLSVNALEAMPNGGVLTVAAENAVLDGKEGLPVRTGDYLHISFSDTGCGIPSKQISLIFDPYFTTKMMGSEKGMGLGLSICHSVISKHEGLITVESGLGKGSTFHVYLPAVHESEQAAKPAAASRRRILFMDDDARVREIVAQMVDFLGYDVELVEKGEDAVEAYQKAKDAGKDFAAVFLDVTVQGGMGGELAMRRLLELDPSVKGVISSGYVDAPIMTDYNSYGFSGAIPKPYRIEDLRNLLSDILA